MKLGYEKYKELYTKCYSNGGCDAGDIKCESCDYNMQLNEIETNLSDAVKNEWQNKIKQIFETN